MTTMRAWFVPFRFAMPTDLETWLEERASCGWSLNRVRYRDWFLMTFEASEPAKCRFVFDLQIRPRRDYVTTYQDFGWEYLGRMSNVHAWRHPYDEVRPEAFTDQESLRAHSRPFRIAVTVLLTLLAVGAAAQVAAALFANGPDGTGTEHLVAGGLLAVVAALVGGIAWRVGRRRERRMV